MSICLYLPLDNHRYGVVCKVYFAMHCSRKQTHFRDWKFNKEYQVASTLLHYLIELHCLANYQSIFDQWQDWKLYLCQDHFPEVTWTKRLVTKHCKYKSWNILQFFKSNVSFVFGMTISAILLTAIINSQHSIIQKSNVFDCFYHSRFI